MQEINSDFEILQVDEDRSWMRRLELTPWIITKHVLLFVATFASVSFSYLQFAIRWEDGLIFSACFLLFLGTHEFGHYMAAVAHRVRVTLPFFIPMPLISIGTLGAVIRIKDPVNDTRRLFDIGVAGPLAGFVVSLILLMIGFFTLPGVQHVMEYPGHEALKAYVQQHGSFPASAPEELNGETLFLGSTLLFDFIASFFDQVPPLYELYHYPVLFAGWLGLFFTALNLMPFGQLDGGHILYALIGHRKHRMVSYTLYSILSGLGGVGAISILQYFFTDTLIPSLLSAWILWTPGIYFLFRFAMKTSRKQVLLFWFVSLSITAVTYAGLADPSHAQNYGMWLFWLFFVVFLIKLDHPPAQIEYHLDAGRKVLGWGSLLIFVLCMSPLPFYFL